MPSLVPNFALPEPEHTDYDDAETVVLPVPFERTTSYGRGTALGPDALLRASCHLEHYDRELDAEPVTQGIATLAPFMPLTFELDAAHRELEDEAFQHLEAGKFLVTIGGEHGVSIGPVRAARRLFPDLGVVQFDAHADLRDEYEGTPYSHASVMRRVLELDVPTLAVGLRSLSREEAELIRERRLPVIWGEELDDAETRFAARVDALPEQVYLTFDVDFFDPSLVPATGTPEPGGGFWTPTLRLLRTLFERRRVVAMDVVELAPIGGQPASDFVAAKLVYKALGYRWIAAGAPGRRVGARRATAGGA